MKSNGGWGSAVMLMRSEWGSFIWPTMRRFSTTGRTNFFKSGTRANRRKLESGAGGTTGTPTAAGKYFSQPTSYLGIRFASRKEARRYQELLILLRTGQIENLRLQVNYPLEINGVKVTSYRADFVYQESGRTVVEDVKGFRTREYRIKQKLMLALHGIQILET